MPSDKTTEPDWRTLPRKGSVKRDQRLTVRLSQPELDAITALAAQLGMGISDLVVTRTLRKKKRT